MRKTDYHKILLTMSVIAFSMLSALADFPLTVGGVSDAPESSVNASAVNGPIGGGIIISQPNVSSKDAAVYYPYGMRYADLMTADVDRYLFSGKELDRMNGLDIYDFHARQYDPLLGRFTSPDPMEEKYPHLSPYAYCAGNPIRFTDPTGMDIWSINKSGNIVSHKETEDLDVLTMSESNSENNVVFKKGTFENVTTQKTTVGKLYDVYQIRGDENATKAFEFLAKNTDVEWSHVKTGIAGNSGLNFLTSSHEKHSEHGIVDLLNNQLRYGYTLREDIHSHPNNTPVPSNRDNNNGDIAHAIEVIKHFGNVTFKIYIPKHDKYIEYQPNYNRLPELLVIPTK